MLNSIKAFKENKLTRDEFETEWFKTLYSKPKKLNNGRLIQVAWTTHPIAQAMVDLRNHSPVAMKKSITQCIKYSKMWWSKSTDTYLFPAYALCLFLDSLPQSDLQITMLDKDKTMSVWADMWETSPDRNEVNLIAMDQHTGQGSVNGIGKNSPYALPSFVLYHSAVRPYTNGKEDTILKYINARLPDMAQEDACVHAKHMESFGRGEINHKDLWDCMVQAIQKMGHQAPPPPEYWKNTVHNPKRKPVVDVYHPHPQAAFHFKSSPLQDGYALDVLVSYMQKSIRRSMLWDAVWVVSRLLLFALFHHETTNNTMWTIYPSAQAKITNLINRLIVITAEDIFPDHRLFLEATHVLEAARKSLLSLKEPQPADLYKQRFESMVVNVLSVVVSLVRTPKQHYVGLMLFKKKHVVLYKEACVKLESQPGDKRKRENGKITNFFKFK